MNSFNHYAFGAVEEWMWRNIIGINPDEEHAGYKHFVIRPQLGKELSWARGSYDSIRGPIRTEWKLDANRLSLDVSVPANSTATVYLPVAAGAEVREGQQPAANAPGVHALELRDGQAAFEVGSGNYRFVVEGLRPAATGGR